MRRGTLPRSKTCASNLQEGRAILLRQRRPGRAGRQGPCDAVPLQGCITRGRETSAGHCRSLLLQWPLGAIASANVQRAAPLCQPIATRQPAATDELSSDRLAARVLWRSASDLQGCTQNRGAISLCELLEVLITQQSHCSITVWMCVEQYPG